METFWVLLERCITVEENDLAQRLLKDRSCNTKWLMTSRNEVMVKQILTGSLDICLDEDSTCFDEAVLELMEIKVNQLTRMEPCDEAFRAVVGDSLCQQVERTFLWVAQACRELGCTSMHHAALKDHASIVKLLVERGADSEDRDNGGWTILQHASWNGYEKMVRYPLKHGANVHSRAENGWTALHQATWNGHAKVVGTLLKGGADPNKTDDAGKTPLHQAVWREHPAVVELLLEEDADPI